MATREEIKEAIDTYTDDSCLYPDKSCEFCADGYCVSTEQAYKCLMKRFGEIGVVLKVDRELPKNPFGQTDDADSAWHQFVLSIQEDMLKWHNDSLESLIKEG